MEPAATALLLAGFFLVVDLAFFGANLSKLWQGGWFPLAVGLFVFTLLTTWKTGRRILAERLDGRRQTVEEFLRSLGGRSPLRVPGTAVFMVGGARAVPPALLHNLKHNQVLHRRVILLTVVIEEAPRHSPGERLQVEPLGEGFYRATIHYGFMDDVDVPRALRRPERVHSLALLEAALPEVLFASPEVGDAVNRTFARCQEGDTEGAFAAFFGAFLGPEYRAALEEGLPTGGIGRAVAGMSVLLENDFPALQNWRFGAEQAAQLTQPTLLVVGAESGPFFRELQRRMQELLPAAETFELPAATHALMMLNPRGMAQGLAAFFARHPLPSTTRVTAPA